MTGSGRTPPDCGGNQAKDYGLLMPWIKSGRFSAEHVDQAMRCVVAEEILTELIRLRSGKCTAGKEVLFIGEERGFNVTGVGGDGPPEFSAVEHCEVGPFARRGHQVRRIA